MTVCGLQRSEWEGFEDRGGWAMGSEQSRNHLLGEQGGVRGCLGALGSVLICPIQQTRSELWPGGCRGSCHGTQSFILRAAVRLPPVTEAYAALCLRGTGHFFSPDC